MIPAPPGIVANYKDHNGPVIPKPVIAFDEDGKAMIRGKHGLIRADSYANFDVISEDTMPTYTGLIPAGGWRVEYTGDDGAKWSQPLVGWAIRPDGEVVPLDTDVAGYVEQLPGVAGTWRVYHPDAKTAESSAP